MDKLPSGFWSDHLCAPWSRKQLHLRKSPNVLEVAIGFALLSVREMDAGPLGFISSFVIIGSVGPEQRKGFSLLSKKTVRRVVATGIMGGAMAFAFPAVAMADAGYAAGGSAAGPHGAYDWSVASYGGHGHSFYVGEWSAAGKGGAASGYVVSGAS